MKYSIILLDADDTLLDFKRAEKEALKITLEYCGLPSDEKVTTAYSEINDGYWKALERGEVTKEALKTGVPVRTLLIEKGVMTAQEVDRILDTHGMTKPGVPGKN